MQLVAEQPASALQWLLQQVPQPRASWLEAAERYRCLPSNLPALTSSDQLQPLSSRIPDKPSRQPDLLTKELGHEDPPMPDGAHWCQGGIILAGVAEAAVTSHAEMAALLERGSLQRATGATNMNATSSRSHAIFTISVEQRRVVAATEPGGRFGEPLLIFWVWARKPGRGGVGCQTSEV